MYIRANFRIKSSVFDLREEASCTISSTRARELSSYFFSTLKSITLLILSIPAKTGSPSRIVLGTLSPVSAEVLKLPLEDNNLPSSGIFSPALTCTISPIETVSGETTKVIPFLTTVALSGLTSSKDLIFFLAFNTAEF